MLPIDLMYHCSVCKKEVTVDNLNPPVHNCHCEDKKMYVAMSATMKPTEFGRYNQLFDFGSDFAVAAALVKKKNKATHVYLYLACHSIENLLKYFICKEGQYIKVYGENNKSLLGHNLTKHNNILKEIEGYDFLKNGALEKEIAALNKLYLMAHLAYGNMNTIFTTPSNFSSEEIFKCINLLLEKGR
jgi:hypothetical protein